MKYFATLICFLILSGVLFAQSAPGLIAADQDTVPSPALFSIDSAISVIREAANSGTLWKSDRQSLRYDMGRLLGHVSEPFDSIELRLSTMDLQALNIVSRDILIKDTIAVRWLNDSTFIIDSLGWSLDLLLKKELELVYPVDFSTLAFNDSILDENGMLDSTLFTPDTILSLSIDTAALEALDVHLLNFSGNRIIPSLDEPGNRRSVRLASDSVSLVTTDTLALWMGDEDTPFQFLSSRNQLDTLQSAVETLLTYLERRDSTRILINDRYGRKTPLWISTGSNDSRRFWVKNYKNDSITLWIGNPSSGEISLLLEDDIDFNRLTREHLDHLPMDLPQPLRKLAKMELLKPNPIFWEYEIANAFTFSQTYFSNWAKGGESSLATMLDISGNATYNNTQAKTQWINTARLKIGTLITQQYGLRKNDDLFEINSQFNKNKWGKFDLSASFYMKNQIAKGYNYPNDSVVVSKFLNPGSLTIGLGLEYKPFKHTSINMAPLSYKNTFVLDTANIDQTAHGISSNKRIRQELGTQILMVNKLKPMEDLTVSSKLRLFSNYLNHPGNIDIDWELLMDKKISWFFTIRVNLHLIYDDDIRFTVFGSDEQPFLLPNGTEKKVARAQFKEFVGLSLLFKF